MCICRSLLPLLKGIHLQAFDIRAVTVHLEAALSKRGKCNDGALDDIDLQEYVLAYRKLNLCVFKSTRVIMTSLCSMFPLFGRIFSFVQSDVEDKEKILQKYVDNVRLIMSNKQCTKSVRSQMASSTLFGKCAPRRQHATRTRALIRRQRRALSCAYIGALFSCDR